MFKKDGLWLINGENLFKLVLLLGIIFYIYPDLRDSFIIMFKNDTSKAGDLLIAISTLVVGSMFAYFSFSYAVVRKEYLIFRILAYLKSFALLFTILLTLLISSVLFPIYLGGMEWLFKLLSYLLISACVLYDVLNVQVMGKDWQ